MTQYLGMTAGELISKVGKEYQYYYRGRNMETGITGNLWFDDDVCFGFSDSGKTLDMSCRVYMVIIASDYGVGIAKNLGNGLSAKMDGFTLKSYFGNNANTYENMLDGCISMNAVYKGFFYALDWSKAQNVNDIGVPPDYITISFPQN